MPRLIETNSRTDAVVAAMNDLLAREGVTALSVRSIARASGVSPSSLLHHYGSRERIMRLAAGRTGRARIRDIERRAPYDGVGAFLPADLDGVVDARAWLGWLELWRSEDMLVEAVGRSRREERALLAWVLDYALAREALDAVSALIDGLLGAICAPVRPLPLPVARGVLTVHVEDALARAAS
jgi:AcrR family transcriptional regulator